MVLVALIAIFSVSIAFAAIDSAKPNHPLQQVAKSATDLTSIDNNNDGIVDGTVVGGAQSVCTGTSDAKRGCYNNWGGASCGTACNAINCPTGSHVQLIANSPCWFSGDGNLASSYCYTNICING